jgi:hypothetical protein
MLVALVGAEKSFRELPGTFVFPEVPLKGKSSDLTVVIARSVRVFH